MVSAMQNKKQNSGASRSMDGMRPRVQPSKQKIKPQAAFPAVGTTLPTYRPSTAGRSSLRPKPVPGVTKDKGRLARLWRPKRIILGTLIIGILIGGYVGGTFLYNTHKLFGGSIFDVLSSATLKGQSSGRVNILLAGNSADDPGHDGADLTDSILLLSINTKTNQAFLLSIPRDLYVAIPGADHEKINDAYVVGQNDSFSQSGYPAGGMGLLEQVVSQDFGIPIDYYALINYAALKDAVNDVGGITVNIQSSDPRGLYDPSVDYATGGPLVKLSNGEHNLNGEEALDLARARGDAYGSYGFAASDFERTANQRLMLVALKQKAETAGVLANPIKLSDLFNAVGGNVQTDLNLSDVRTLYTLTKSDTNSTIASLSLNNVNGTDLLANYTTYDGQSALVPAAGIDDYSQIQAYLQQITSSNPVVQENASVVVLNATNTDGLASTQRSALMNQHVNVTAIGDATATQAITTIIDNSAGKYPATRALLVKRYGNNVTTTNPYSGIYQANFIIVVGTNQSPASNTGD
jgi:LCP family protein required for cell wall assembly